MHLEEQRHLAVGEARDQVELPQRPVAVEWSAVDPGDEFGERVGVVGIGHRDVSQVVVEIETRMVAPPRPVESERYVDERLAQHGEVVESGLDLASQECRR